MILTTDSFIERVKDRKAGASGRILPGETMRKYMILSFVFLGFLGCKDKQLNFDGQKL